MRTAIADRASIRRMSDTRLQAMDWDVFLEAHFRPHLVVLHAPSLAGRDEGRRLVKRVLAASGFAGNHARRSNGPVIHVAFELADDAQRFAAIVGAHSSVREPEWASRSTAWLTPPTRQRIVRHLEQRARSVVKRDDADLDGTDASEGLPAPGARSLHRAQRRRYSSPSDRKHDRLSGE